MCPTGESEPVHLDHRLRTARTVRPRSPPHLPTGEPACAASGPTIGPFIPGRTRPGSPRTGPPPATEKEPETTHQRRHRNRDNVVATVVVPDWQRRLIRNVGSPGHWTGACDPPALSEWARPNRPSDLFVRHRTKRDPAPPFDDVSSSAVRGQTGCLSLQQFPRIPSCSPPPWGAFYFLDLAFPVFSPRSPLRWHGSPVPSLGATPSILGTRVRASAGHAVRSRSMVDW